MVALQLLVDHPERVRAALVASTGPMLTFPGAAELIQSWNELWRSENGPVRRLDSTWPFLTTEPFRDSLAGRAFFASWRRTLTDVSGESLAAVATGLLQFDVTGQLPSVRAPVFVVAGEYDRLARPDMVRTVADLVPGSRFEVVGDSGHLVNLERPDAFNDVLAGLLVPRS
jgi:3-oxoadipate enol-lactonase